MAAKPGLETVVLTPDTCVAAHPSGSGFASCNTGPGCVNPQVSFNLLIG